MIEAASDLPASRPPSPTRQWDDDAVFPIGTGYTEWVSAAPFRAHVRHLSATSGVPWRVLARLAGVSPTAVQRLLRGRDGRAVRRIDPTLARRLFALTPQVLDGLRQTMVPAGAAGRELHRLIALGWTRHSLSVRLQVPVDVLDQLLVGTEPGDPAGGAGRGGDDDTAEAGAIEGTTAVCSRLVQARILAGAPVLGVLATGCAA